MGLWCVALVLLGFRGTGGCVGGVCPGWGLWGWLRGVGRVTLGRSVASRCWSGSGLLRWPVCAVRVGLVRLSGVGLSRVRALVFGLGIKSQSAWRGSHVGRRRVLRCLQTSVRQRVLCLAHLAVLSFAGASEVCDGRDHGHSVFLRPPASPVQSGKHLRSGVTAVTLRGSAGWPTPPVQQPGLCHPPTRGLLCLASPALFPSLLRAAQSVWERAPRDGAVDMTCRPRWVMVVLSERGSIRTVDDYIAVA